MAKLTQALREEVARLPAGRRCCAFWELRALELAMREADGWLRGAPSLLAERLRVLGEEFGFGTVSRPAITRGPTIEGGKLDLAFEPARPLESPGGALRRCCRAGVLRGAIWKGAYLNTDGHLEFVGPAALLALLRRTRLPFLDGLRAGRPLLYLKDQEAIAEAIGMMEAVETMLALEDLLVTKRMRNDINRVVNCEVGNLARTSRSAALVLEAIRLLENHGGLDGLPDRLREVAVLRLRHPTASLRELAQRARPGLTKSGVQHRLDEIGRLAGELRRQHA